MGGILFARLSRCFAFVVTGLGVLLPVQAMQKVKEVAVPSLPDIAMVHFAPGQQPVILYNPFLCREAGPALCEFYRYHEYAHIELRHHERDGLSRQEKEIEADRWAAQHAPFASVIAAYKFFSAGGGGTPMHGTSNSRAERMLARTETGNRFVGSNRARAAQADRELAQDSAARQPNDRTPLMFGALAL
jgi:hypothetical protein